MLFLPRTRKGGRRIRRPLGQGRGGGGGHASALAARVSTQPRSRPDPLGRPALSRPPSRRHPPALGPDAHTANGSPLAQVARRLISSGHDLPSMPHRRPPTQPSCVLLWKDSPARLHRIRACNSHLRSLGAIPNKSPHSSLDFGRLRQLSWSRISHQKFFRHAFSTVDILPQTFLSSR